MDLNFLFGGHSTHTPTPIFERIANLWQNNPIATAKPIFQQRDSVFWQHLRDYAFPSNDLFDEIVEQLANYVGTSVEEEMWYWDQSDPIYAFGGAAYGFDRSTLDGELIDELKKIMEVTMSDEMAMAIYMRAKDYQASDVDDIFTAFKWNSGSKDEIELYSEAPTIFSSSEHTDFEVWLSQHQQ